LPYTIGLAFDLLPAVLFLHVFLAFPRGDLETRAERIVVAAGYFAGVGLQLLKMLLGGFIPDNLLGFFDNLAAANTVEDVQLFMLAGASLAGIPLLFIRRRASGRPLRPWVEVLVYSFAIGLVMVAVLLIAGSFGWSSFETIRRITFVTIGLSPIAFLIGLLSARLARSTVGDLLVELHADPAPADLPKLFARALRDPSLTLAYWLPQYERWADLDGRPVTLPPDRAITVIEHDGVRQAALVHDRSLEDEPELLDAVSAAAGIALQNGRLQAELRARLEELRGSRERVLEAGQKERQRLERNLHDGAQQRLIALSLDLSMLEAKLGDDPDARDQLEQARREIAQSLEELRAVAHGLHPAVVSGHGLAVALESLAAHAPVPVRLDVDLVERVDEQLEVAAYYVVSESLANIGKHAQASSATIAVTRDDGQLVVEIVDDGVGGADSEAGSGLRGLADRVEALDGRLRVWTPRGGGTRVRAEMPCG
jgi:signal transduction histidine kinase